MTTNSYGKNNYWYYTINMLITVSFCATMIIAYTKTNPWITTSVIIYIALFSYFLLIKPAIKIYGGTADIEDLNAIGVFPILGLFRTHCTLYQLMEKKLANGKAIQECENALESMSYTGGNSNDLRDGWDYFKDWFPKIDDSNETCKERCTLMESALSIAIRHEEIDLHNSFDERATQTGYALLMEYKNEKEIEKTLRKKIQRNAVFQDISPRAFDAELKERTSRLDKLRENLITSNMDLTFKEMCKIQN